MSETNAIMWILTILLVIGFLLTYRNLNGERIIFDSKYEGLIISVLALIGSVYVGVNTSNKGLEAFKKLYA